METSRGDRHAHEMSASLLIVPTCCRPSDRQRRRRAWSCSSKSPRYPITRRESPCAPHGSRLRRRCSALPRRSHRQRSAAGALRPCRSASIASATVIGPATPRCPQPTAENITRSNITKPMDGRDRQSGRVSGFMSESSRYEGKLIISTWTRGTDFGGEEVNPPLYGCYGAGLSRGVRS
jgi:hypothetical protein